ncbi:MAG: DUF4331 family protein [bacterium]|nr:DUF4331 family protein [bacterium]
MRKSFFLFSVIGIVVIAAALFTTSQWTDASSHREAPIISTDPVADNTDVYAFRPADDPGTLCIIASYNPLEEPAGGPNFNKFGTDVLYEIKIDNVGDRIDHISYQFEFFDAVANGNTFLYNTGDVTTLSDPDLNVKQTYVVKRVVNGVTQWTSSPLPVPPCYVGGNSHSDPNYAGPPSMSNYAALMSEGVKDLPNSGGKVFCGPTDDAFYVDLGAAFDLLKIRPGAPGNAGGGKDALAGFNVHSICIKVPIGDVTRNGSINPPATDSNAIVGVWATASRKTTTVINPDGTRSAAGSWVYVSRLGMPLVNEVVLPLGQKDKWNASEPVNDAQFLSYVLNPELAGIINLLYPVTDDIPTTNRADLVAVFLTGVAGLNQRPQDLVTPSEQLRINLGIAPVPFANENRLGVIAGDVAGFPNGRRLKDDVIDIALRVVAGVLLGPPYSTGINSQLGDAVRENDKPFQNVFPYLAGPNEGYVNSHGLIDNGPGNLCPVNLGIPLQPMLVNALNCRTDTIKFSSPEIGEITTVFANANGLANFTAVSTPGNVGQIIIKFCPDATQAGNNYPVMISAYDNASPSCTTTVTVNYQVDGPTPVELTSFTSLVTGRDITISWTTATEENNSGFDVERFTANNEWTKLGFITGNGNSGTPNSYSYTDKRLNTGKYKYRLKQTDFNGNFKYYNLSNEVVIGVPGKFELSQNYPNPFNPATKIEYAIPSAGKVSLLLYDAVGREVANLVNNDLEAGYYSVDFDASQFASGVYYYKLNLNGQSKFSDTKKMLLVK